MVKIFIKEEISSRQQADRLSNTEQPQKSIEIRQLIKRGRRRGVYISSINPISKESVKDALEEEFSVDLTRPFDVLNTLEVNNSEELINKRKNLELFEETEDKIDFCITQWHKYQEDENKSAKMYYWVTIDFENHLLYYRFKRKPQNSWLNDTENDMYKYILRFLEIENKHKPYDDIIYSIYRDLISEAEAEIAPKVEEYESVIHRYNHELLELGLFKENEEWQEEHLTRSRDLIERILLKKASIIDFVYKTEDFLFVLKNLIYKDSYSGVNASEERQENDEEVLRSEIFLDIRQTLNEKRTLKELLFEAHFLKDGERLEVKDQDFDFEEGMDKYGIRLSDKEDYFFINFNHIYLTKEIENLIFSYLNTKLVEVGIQI